MTEHHPRIALGDNPPDHDVLILVVQAFDTYMENDQQWKRETSEMLRELNKKVETQNGNVAKVTSRANDHDKWHGDNDEKLATRVATLWKDREAALIRRGVYLSEWKAFAWAIGVAASFGVGGLLLGRFA